MDMTTQATGIVPTLTRGQRLSIAMSHAGLTADGMAAQMRCSAGTIRNYISGRTRIDFAHLSMWSQVTGVDLGWLEGDGEDGPDAPVDSRARNVRRNTRRNWFPTPLVMAAA